MTALDIGFVCDAGDKRKTNEDNVLIKTCRFDKEEWGLFLVADGMGGHTHGDEASRSIASTLLSWWNNTFMSIISNAFNLSEVSESLDNAICFAHQKVRDIARISEKVVGSTLSLLLWMGSYYIIRHIGDSRIYRLNPAAGFEQLTPDHSYVADQVRAGRLTPGEARVHPKRNVINKCIGMNKPLDFYKNQFACAMDDIFIVCSDGFYGTVSDEAVQDMIYSNLHVSMQKKADALRTGIGSGQAYDNVSLILVRPYRVNSAEDTETM